MRDSVVHGIDLVDPLDLYQLVMDRLSPRAARPKGEEERTKESVHPEATVCPHFHKNISKMAMVGQGMMGLGCLMMIAVSVLFFLLLLLVGMFSS